jgi:hypothetical protein
MDADMCRAEFGECRYRFSLLRASTVSHNQASSHSVEAFYLKTAAKSNPKSRSRAPGACQMAGEPAWQEWRRHRSEPVAVEDHETGTGRSAVP